MGVRIVRRNPVSLMESLGAPDFWHSEKPQRHL
jgi:hypothetical protein